MTITTNRPAESGARFTVQPADFGAGSTATCAVCGVRTRKMGSDRKAIAAIRDHLRDAHGA